MPDPRWFQIMTNLLYPAVLGTLIYTFAQHSLAEASLSDPMFVGGLALLVLFVMDYAHSLRDDVRTSYDRWKFLADFIVVVGLFLAGTAVLSQPVFPTVAYVWWLFMAKVAAVAWERAEAAHRPEAAEVVSRMLFGLETDWALLVVYFGLAVVSLMETTWWQWAVAIAMVVDAVQYFRYGRVAPTGQATARR